MNNCWCYCCRIKVFYRYVSYCC